MTTVSGVAPATKGRLPAGRRDRRPALAALALLLVLVGALGSALVAFRSGSRVDVLVARHDIFVGEQVDRSDFTTTRVAADSDSVIDAEAAGNFVGSFALGTIPEGAILHSQMFGLDAVPANGEQVGIVVAANRLTTERPEVGDVVRLYYVSSGSGGGAGGFSAGDPVVEAARVLRVGSAGSGATSLTVLVREQDAGVLANLAANNQVAVTLLAKGTEPVIDEGS